jgi:hypothetical protein
MNPSPVRLDHAHMVNRTANKQEAARFNSMIAAVGKALTLPGKWREVCVSVNLEAGEVS